MAGANKLAELGALIGEPARAAMLSALMDGRALTAGELSKVSGITPQTTSGHLKRLLAADVLSVERQGKHRYFRLSRPEIARLLESMMQISTGSQAKAAQLSTGPRDAAMHRARTCYDHMAGRFAVALADVLQERGLIAFGDEPDGSGSGLVTAKGERYFTKLLGAPLHDGAKGRSRPLCRPCLDWSERRPHVAGVLGQVLCTHFLDRGYVRRVKQRRTLSLTPKGLQFLAEEYGIRDV